MALRVLRDLFRGAFGDDLAAAAPAFGTEVDDVVGVGDDVEVVLDDDDGVPLLDEPLEDVEELRDVLEVESRRRFVEDVDGAAAGALLQLRCEFDALRLTAGQGRRRLSEAHVAEADVDERRQMP